MKKDFSIGEALAAGWRTTMANAGLIFAVEVVFLGLVLIPKVAGVYVAGSPIVFLVVQLLGYLIQSFLTLGVVEISLRLMQNKSSSFDDLFSQGSKLVPYIVATILFAVALIIGFALLIIPGIIVIAGWGLYPYFIVANQAGDTESLSQSWRLTRGVRLKFVIFLALSFLIVLAGALVFGIGLLLALPVVTNGWTHVWLKLMKQQPKRKKIA